MREGDGGGGGAIIIYFTQGGISVGGWQRGSCKTLLFVFSPFFYVLWPMFWSQPNGNEHVRGRFAIAVKPVSHLLGYIGLHLILNIYIYNM